MEYPESGFVDDGTGWNNKERKKSVSKLSIVMEDDDSSIPMGTRPALSSSTLRSTSPEARLRANSQLPKLPERLEGAEF